VPAYAARRAPGAVSRRVPSGDARLPGGLHAEPSRRLPRLAGLALRGSRCAPPTPGTGTDAAEPTSARCSSPGPGRPMGPCPRRGGGRRLPPRPPGGNRRRPAASAADSERCPLYTGGPPLTRAAGARTATPALSALRAGGGPPRAPGAGRPPTLRRPAPSRSGRAPLPGPFLSWTWTPWVGHCPGVRRATPGPVPAPVRRRPRPVPPSPGAPPAVPALRRIASSPAERVAGEWMPCNLRPPCDSRRAT
jgi:hypothetical protein